MDYEYIGDASKAVESEDLNTTTEQEHTQNRIEHTDEGGEQPPNRLKSRI